MEYNPIFGNADFGAYREVQFRNKYGELYTIFRVIYNGRKYIYNGGSGGGGGSEGGGGSALRDGAVAVSSDFSVWKFITPPDRWDMSHFAPLPLRDSLSTIVEDTRNAPIPAWDEFFHNLAEPQVEQIANQAIHGGFSSLGIAYRKANLPLIQGCTDFPSFMALLGDNCGEAGDIPTEFFLNGQELIIPLDQYVATPVRFMCRTVPTERPNDYGTDNPVFRKGDTTICAYGTKGGFYSAPVLYFDYSLLQYVYSFEEATDANGAVIPAGWSTYGGGTYTSRNLGGDGLGLQMSDDLTYSYLAKVFYNIEYETAETNVYQVKSTIDMSSIPSDFTALSYDFEFMVIEEGDNRILYLATGATEDRMTVYGYASEDMAFDGMNIVAGWNTLNPSTGEAMPYDMERNPLRLNFVAGESEVSDMDDLRAIADYLETTEKAKESLYGTTYFILQA